MSESVVERHPDEMFRNFDEAKGWVDSADLWDYPVILEDHLDGEHIATARVQGANGVYSLEITNHEGSDSTIEKTVGSIEVAEMMGGWKVAGRERHTETDGGQDDA
jgi:hypothetical protein